MKNTYNGWKNYETWNVALWIGNDEGLYQIAKGGAADDSPYESFRECLRDFEYTGSGISVETPDRVAWDDSGLDIDALDEMIREL